MAATRPSATGKPHCGRVDHPQLERPAPLPSHLPSPTFTSALGLVEPVGPTSTRAIALTETPPHPPSLTATPTPAPRFYEFVACLQSCSEVEADLTRSFPEGTTKLYAAWNYENIPIGARYVRRWTMNDNEWVRYECIWPGPEAGSDQVALTEPGGLHSGTWEVSIMVGGKIVMVEQIVVEGNWDYWSSAGVFGTCYGKR